MPKKHMNKRVLANEATEWWQLSSCIDGIYKYKIAHK